MESEEIWSFAWASLSFSNLQSLLVASPRLSLPRDSRFSTLQIILAYAGRFSDELMGGLPDVLMPTIQQQLGLSLAQVTGLTNAMLIVFLPAVIVMGWLVLRL